MSTRREHTHTHTHTVAEDLPPQRRAEAYNVVGDVTRAVK